VHPVISDALRNLISGVLPTASMKSERVSMSKASVRSGAVQRLYCTVIVIFSERTGG
jgi:hypothetical protein